MTEEDLREHLIKTLLIRVEKRVRGDFDHYVKDWSDHYDRNTNSQGIITGSIDAIDLPTMLAAKVCQIAQNQDLDAALLWKLSQNSG